MFIDIGLNIFILKIIENSLTGTIFGSEGQKSEVQFPCHKHCISLDGVVRVGMYGREIKDFPTKTKQEPLWKTTVGEGGGAPTKGW
mgnify:CR=1 FL=1